MSSRPTFMKSVSSRGITIIEVLVVVAITAVMVVALLPALSKARAAVNTLRCAQNQGLIFQALMSYQATYITQPHRSPNRREDGVYAAGDPVSGACIWGEGYTTPGVNVTMGQGQLISTGFLTLNQMFCPENNELQEFSESAERRWNVRRFLFSVPYTAGGVAGDNYIKAYPGGDGLGLPQPTTASLYYRSHFLYRSGDWSYTTSMSATTGVANGRVAFLKSSTAGFNNKIILMDFRHWYHERSGSGVNETWGDGSTIFKRNSNVNGGNILSAWRTYGAVTYNNAVSVYGAGNVPAGVSLTSTVRNGMSWQGCAYFDKYEQAGR